MYQRSRFGQRNMFCSICAHRLLCQPQHTGPGHFPGSCLPASRSVHLCVAALFPCIGRESGRPPRPEEGNIPQEGPACLLRYSGDCVVWRLVLVSVLKNQVILGIIRLASSRKVVHRLRVMSRGSDPRRLSCSCCNNRAALTAGFVTLICL